MHLKYRQNQFQISGTKIVIYGHDIINNKYISSYVIVSQVEFTPIIGIIVRENFRFV